MATNNTKPVKEEPKVKPIVPESTYSAAELTRAHKTLGASYEIVAVALKQAGKERATFTEAQEIVDRFKTREVK